MAHAHRLSFAPIDDVPPPAPAPESMSRYRYPLPMPPTVQPPDAWFEFNEDDPQHRAVWRALLWEGLVEVCW